MAQPGQHVIGWTDRPQIAAGHEEVWNSWQRWRQFALYPAAPTHTIVPSALAWVEQQFHWASAAYRAMLARVWLRLSALWLNSEPRSPAPEQGGEPGSEHGIGAGTDSDGPQLLD